MVRDHFAAGDVRAALDDVAAAVGIGPEAATIDLDELLGDGVTTSGRVRPPDADD